MPCRPALQSVIMVKHAMHAFAFSDRKDAFTMKTMPFELALQFGFGQAPLIETQWRNIAMFSIKKLVPDMQWSEIVPEMAKIVKWHRNEKPASGLQDAKGFLKAIT